MRRGLSDAGFLLAAELLANDSIDVDAILAYVRSGEQLELWVEVSPPEEEQS